MKKFKDNKIEIFPVRFTVAQKDRPYKKV